MEKRTLLAVILSILVIVTFQFWMSKQYPKQQQPQLPETVETELKEPQMPGEPLAVAERPTIENEEEYIAETDRIVFTFSNVGGSIKKIELKEFKDSETGEPFELVNIKDPRFYMGAFNLVKNRLPDNAIYQLRRYDNKISYIYKDANIEIEKRYRFHNYNDYIELYITLKNLSQHEIKTSSRIIAGSYINVSGAMSHRYINVSAKVDGRILRDRRAAFRSGDVSWVALNSKYFCILLRPYQLGRKAFTNLIEKSNLLGGIESGQFVIPPGAEMTQQYVCYIGPADTNRLKALDMGLEDAVNYGVFHGISKILLSTLRFFHKIVRNWGVAIICLTILVNGILYPLTRKSYKSMKAMQELQPHIDKLRTAHKDSPHKLNKELMELYKKYNVNPLGGCLPLLLQMPIFIALYHALVRSIELKGANFLWIKDLSKPDAVKLPFTLPVLGDSINILPILMMIAMIFQQKFASPHKTGETSEQQKQQQQMMMFMPAIFVIIFYTLPSGLVLYWLVNTVLMMIHHYHIRKAPAKIAESR